MERLGGGGNHSAAGAQLKNTTPEEADKLITDAIRGYFDDQRTEKQAKLFAAFDIGQYRIIEQERFCPQYTQKE